MEDVYLLLGSNLGDRGRFLQRAIAEVTEKIAKVEKVSSVFETAPWGKNDEPAYLNQAVFFKSLKTAKEILRITQEIELHLGRQREEKWGSRTIDIDILFYGDQIIEEPELIIPHLHFHNRRFAVEPMLEMAPDLVHPRLKKTVRVLSEELTDNLSVEKI